MTEKKIYTAIGLMSGTSMDGIDASIIKTDGYDFVQVMGSTCVPTDPSIKNKLQNIAGSDKKSPQDRQETIKTIEQEFTYSNIDAIKEVLACCELKAKDIDLIGFHGQTITHKPEERFTWQIGDALLLSKETGCKVIHNFRENDVINGGQGAPLIPLYHKTKLLSSKVELPACVINIGGVSNITMVYSEDNNDMLAFDTGPGNALIDDFLFKRRGLDMDRNGQVAKNGRVKQDFLQKWLSNPHFSKKPPKSLDRNAFQCEHDLRLMSDEDGAATLTAFTCFAISQSVNDTMKQRKSSEKIKSVYVSGGGRHNLVIMNWLNDLIDAEVYPVENLGWQGDFIESEGFAYLAVRSLLGLPISFPFTTGVSKPLTGGELCDYSNL